MNQESIFETDQNFSKSISSFRDDFFKYFFFWKFFASSVAILILFAFIFLRYSPVLYLTKAKIKILDKKENSFEMPMVEDLFSNSKINLENEIEILKSYPLFKQVCKNLKMQISINAIGDITDWLIVDYPFEVTTNLNIDNLSENTYRLNILENGLEIIDFNKDITYDFQKLTTNNVEHDLPFNITNVNLKKHLSENCNGYYIQFISESDVILDLK